MASIIKLIPVSFENSPDLKTAVFRFAAMIHSMSISVRLRREIVLD